MNTHIDAMVIQVSSLFKLNENKTFTDAEILEATNLIKTKYYFLKWDDLLLFVQNIKLGKYNDIYNRWDMPTFFQMLDRYVDERIEVATTLNRVKQTERNNEPLSEQTLKLIQKVKGELAKKSFKSEVKIGESEESKLVNSWHLEFMGLYKKTGRKGFIKFEGKRVSKQAFLDLKYKAYLESL